MLKSLSVGGGEVGASSSAFEARFEPLCQVPRRLREEAFLQGGIIGSRNHRSTLDVIDIPTLEAQSIEDEILDGRG